MVSRATASSASSCPPPAKGEPRKKLSPSATDHMLLQINSSWFYFHYLFTPWDSLNPANPQNQPTPLNHLMPPKQQIPKTETRNYTDPSLSYPTKPIRIRNLKQNPKPQTHPFRRFAFSAWPCRTAPSTMAKKHSCRWISRFSPQEEVEEVKDVPGDPSKDRLFFGI